MSWVAEHAGCSLTHASLAWLLQQVGVTSILMGARNQQQLTQNLQCLACKLPPVVVELLADAGQCIVDSLGDNLDPYETAAFSRIQ